MKWPWVARSSADMIERRRVGDAALYEKQIEWLGAKYDTLLEKYDALRLKGAGPAEPALPVPAPWTPPPQVMHAIRAISPHEDATYRANMALCYQHKDDVEKDPSKFAARILRGRATDTPPERAD